MNKGDIKGKGELIKKALKIVDELGNIDDDKDYWEGDDTEKIEELIIKAKKMKKNRLWKLN